MNIDQRVQGAISGDEIGLWSARIGDVVLRNAYQLIFRRDGDELEAVAAEGFLRPMREGLTVDPRAYMNSLAAGERSFVSRVGVALHLANHIHIGVDDIDVVVALRKEDSTLRGQDFFDMIGRIDIDPSALLFHFREADRMTRAVLAEQSQELIDLGARLAIGHFAHPFLPAIRQVMPGVAAIRGEWFRRVCQHDPAKRLFAQLVEGFKREGMAVWVEGIETCDQLDVACHAGADLLSGYLLCRPQLAGTDMEATLNVRSLLHKRPFPADPSMYAGNNHRNT